MPNGPAALVTGANQGIGLQIANDLVPHGFTVLAGSRHFEKGQTAAKTKASARLPMPCSSILLIMNLLRQRRSVSLRRFGRLDVLIQNAAISNTNKMPGQSVEEYSKTRRPSVVSPDEMRAVWDQLLRCSLRLAGDVAAPACNAGRPHRSKGPVVAQVISLATNCRPLSNRWLTRRKTSWISVR
jgi:NAD(P)-dependent dehydrogenase (short-subunit alcohol dehydrogenase family)